MIKFNLLNLVILFLPTCSFASQISLNEINVYLNDIKTLQAEFQQRNNDNSVSHGVLFIKKPNKLRMEYEQPNNGLVLINNQLVTIFDFESNNLSQTFPLENTSVHLSISSGETRRFERSIYPLSLSTRITTTGSVLPTRISLLIDLIRRRLNSLNNIIPVIRKRSMIDNNCHSVRLCCDFFLV